MNADNWLQALGPGFVLCLLDFVSSHAFVFVDIVRSNPHGPLFFTLGFQFFFSFKGVVSLAFFKQLVDVLLVDVLSFGLLVRAVVPADVRTFIPVDPQPVQVFDLRFSPAFNVSGGVSVFDSQNQSPLVVTCKQIVKQSSTRVTNVQVASW